MIDHTIEGRDLETMMAGEGGQNEFSSLLPKWIKILQLTFM